MSLDKRAIVEAATVELTRTIEALKASADATREGATHEESRQENPKDTRGLEASYLARGQAQRVVEMQGELARLRTMDLRAFDDEPVKLSAVVTVDVDGEERRYFLAAGGGGTEVTVDGVRYQLITPATPVGRALINREVGDGFELKLAGKSREYEIIAVA